VRCEKCGAILEADDGYEHAGQVLCEDCYLDIKAAPKVCDPWAVYTAKKEASQNPTLTSIQEKILNLIREKGEVTAEEICRETGIKEEEFRRNFAALRHMELARATKKGDEIYFTTFST